MGQNQRLFHGIPFVQPEKISIETKIKELRRVFLEKSIRIFWEFQ